MPAGVDGLVQDGVATLEFTDQVTKGERLAKLLEHAPADQVRKVTRPRVGYVVPEEFARAAGLLDDSAVTEPEPELEPTEEFTPPPASEAEPLAEPLADGDPETPAEEVDPEPVLQTWPDGAPTDKWSRDELNDYALGVHGIDATTLDNKAEVLAAIAEAKKA